MSGQTHVVVLGAGYAGLTAAVRLAKKAGADVAITLIDEPAPSASGCARAQAG